MRIASFFLLLPLFLFARTFTLEEAVGYALLNNHLLKAEDQEIATKEAAVGEKTALSSPKFLFQGQTKRLGRTNTASFAPGQTFVSSNRAQYSAQFQFLYPLYQFGKDDIQIKVAMREARIEELERLRLERDVTQKVKEAYFTLFLAQKLSKLSKKEIEHARAFQGLTEKKVKGGKLPTLELRRAEVQTKEVEKKYQEALHNVKKAQPALMQEMGYPLTEPFAIDLELPEPFLPQLDTKNCVDQALANRPELQRIILEQQNALDGLELARRASFPETQLFVNYLLQKGNRFARRQNYEMGFLFKADIYDGGFARSNLRQLRHQVKGLRERIEDTQEKVALEVGLRILDIKEAFTQYQLALKQVSLAEELTTIQEKRFENGFGIALEVLDAQNRLLSAKIGLAQARTNFFLALEKLENASGGQCWQTKEK